MPHIASRQRPLPVSRAHVAAPGIGEVAAIVGLILGRVGAFSETFASLLPNAAHSLGNRSSDQRDLHCNALFPKPKQQGLL